MTGNVHNIPELSLPELRKFGFVTGSVAAVIFGLALPWLFDLNYPRWPWYLLAILAIAAVTLPQALRPVYRIWMKLGLLISRVTTPIILGIVFFLVVAPFGIVRRILGKDSMNRRFDNQIASYRIDSKDTDRNSLENPF